MAIVRGRDFTAADRDGAPAVAIVSDAVAAATWPGQDPIGKRVKFGGVDSRNEWITVVGVAATTRYRELATPRPTLVHPGRAVRDRRRRVSRFAPPRLRHSSPASSVTPCGPSIRPCA